MNPFSLEGKLALVTGASSGIGFGAVRSLRKAGASVVMVARRVPELVKAAAELQGATETLQGVTPQLAISAFDLQNTKGIAPWYAECVHRYGQPSILVNAAGITRRGSAIDLSLSDWNDTIAVNATAIFELSRCFARGLINSKEGGKIVNIASLMTAAARLGTSAYAASKGAVGQLTKSLAIDWAAHQIHVNAVAPGYINTALNRELIADPEFDQWVKKRCPLGRWGTPEDVSWPIVFLASAASDFITGQVIYVDGGWLSTF